MFENKKKQELKGEIHCDVSVATIHSFPVLLVT